MQQSRYAILLSCLTIAFGLTQHASAQFSTTEAPKRTPTIDGDPSEWDSFGGNTLQMSWAHNERSGDPDSEPLVIDIRYAWDDENFYTLVEEVSDDDPAVGDDAVDWCHECVGGPETGPAQPWSTDSVGFYDKGITWPDNEEEQILERGPFTQYWVGLPPAENINDEDIYHLARVRVGENAEGGARLIGPASEQHGTEFEDDPELPDLLEPQAAHAVIDGKRVTEFYMRWDQIRYDEEHERAVDGHTIVDVREGYEFRMEPLLVDGTEEYQFGSQTHPSGIEHPHLVLDFDDVSIVRLLAGGVDGDLDGDGALGAGDMDTLSAAIRAGDTATRFDVNGDGAVDAKDRLEWINTVAGSFAGDSNFDGEFNSTDFVEVFQAGQYEDGVAGNSSWATGDWNGDTEFDSSDFVLAFQEGGYEMGPRAAVATVPEPATITLLAFSCLAILGWRRRT